MLLSNYDCGVSEEFMVDYNVQNLVVLQKVANNTFCRTKLKYFCNA